MSLEELILARVATLATFPTPKELAKSLARFVPSDVTPAAWSATIAEHLAGFQANRDWFEQAVRALRRPGATWRHVATKKLPALGLVVEVSTRDLARLVSRDDWAAAIVAGERQLWTSGAPPRLPALCDALAWRAMGLTTKPQRLPGDARAYFVRRALPDADGPFDRMIRSEAARIVGAPRSDTRALCDALVRRWVAGKVPPPPGLELPFADRVRDLARATTTGVFGDRKVFIASVWDAAGWTMTFDEFKTALVAAHRNGEVVLARADLVGAMDPELVARSETRWDGASYHFIVREAP